MKPILTVLCLLSISGCNRSDFANNPASVTGEEATVETSAFGTHLKGQPVVLSRTSFNASLSDALIRKSSKQA
jgi:hypothetical protein